MSGRLFQLRSFLTYWLDAVDDHSLHSPFLFDLYAHVIRKKNTPINNKAEQQRVRLLHDQRTITVNDLGAGRETYSPERNVRDIASVSLTPVKYSQLYARLIEHFKYKTIVELGSSLGINTLYLALCKEASVYTLEGADTIADIAEHVYAEADANNIHMIRGNIDKTLQPTLEKLRRADFIFIDANHRYAPVIRYFNTCLSYLQPSGMMVIDDIYLNEEMARAWREIKNHKLVYASVDLFRCGLVFFDPSLNRQHVVLQF